MGDAEPRGDPVLLSHRQMLQIICRSISAFSSEIKDAAYQPPIKDMNTDYSEPEVAGLTKFEGLCAKELAHHEYVGFAHHLRCPDRSYNALFPTAAEYESLCRQCLQQYSLPIGCMEGGVIGSEAGDRSQP